MNNPNIVDGRRIYNPDELTGPNYLVAGSEQAATRVPTTRAYTDAAGLWVCCRFGAFGSKMSPLIQSSGWQESGIERRNGLPEELDNHFKGSAE